MHMFTEYEIRKYLIIKDFSNNITIWFVKIIGYCNL